MRRYQCLIFGTILLLALPLKVFALEWPHYPANNINCDDCHALHSDGMGGWGFFPQDADQEAMCKSCHNPTGQASEMTAVANHKDGSGEIIVDCGDCHDAHSPDSPTDPHTGQTAPNLKLIRSNTAKYVSGALEPNIFQVRPEHFAFDDSSPPWNGVCQTCHTQTKHHTNDETADHVHEIHPGEACTACHSHEDGFRPSCKNCHDEPQGSRRQVFFNETTQEGGDFDKTSHHVVGETQGGDCTLCHYMGDHQAGIVKLKDPDQGQSQLYEFEVVGPAGIEDFCVNCHDADGAAAGAGTQPFSDGVMVPNVKGVPGSLWADSAHNVAGYPLNGGDPISCFGDGEITGCHGNAHGSENEKILSADAGVKPIDQFCFNCHTEGKVQNDALSNNRPGGYTSADDIQEAFSKSSKHSLGTSFTYGGNTYTLQCTTCHNPHVVTGKYWEAETGKSPITRPDLDSDPSDNPRAMGTVLWGAVAGEKMDDFAAQASGTGGFYWNIASGYALGETGLPYGQTAIYQPPKAGSGFETEFQGDVLPDYTTLCLDCHSYRMSDAVPPVNWGQGIGCTGNSVDPPNQRVACGTQHGLGSAGKPSYISDEGKAGFWGSSGNPDVIFHVNYVTRGRHSGHFMRWPYDSAERSAGINFVMSCTDCHEAHGSSRGGTIRERFNVNPDGGCGSGSSGQNCADGGNWNSFCNACHYYYGGQHAGMSCGNASCHEANSIHRIIHDTGSGGSTQLMLTAAGYEDSFQRPDFTPEIISVEGFEGSDQLAVTFSKGVYANPGDRSVQGDEEGALDKDDFWIFDANGDNPKTIVSVTHTAGDATATLTMSAPLIAADLFNDTLSTTGLSAWAWYEGGYENAATGTIPAQDVAAGPWPVTIPSGCPTSTTFALNEASGSTTARDSSLLLTGAVSDPYGVFFGDGYFHGDGVDDYIDFENNDHCLQASTSVTVEARVKPEGIGTDNYIRRILARDGGANYQMSVWRNINWTTYNPPDGVASIAFWLKAVDDHGGKAWKVVLTDYDACPIVSDHWYRVRAVWNSAKTGGIPSDIFVDDQGTDGVDGGEYWSGYINCTDADQSQVSEDNRLYEGDEISPYDGDFVIGANVNNHANHVFFGLIDWIAWNSAVDYSGLDDSPTPPQ